MVGIPPDEEMPVIDGNPNDSTGNSGGPYNNYSGNCDDDEEMRKFLRMAKALKEADIDGDGVVRQDELDFHKKKLVTQRRIAITALIVMCFLGIYITIFLPLDRVTAVASALDLLWVTFGGIIAAYMGVEAWISRKN